MPEDSEGDVDEDTQALLTSDFEIGHYIRERIVPRAVLYYTGNLTSILQFNEYCDSPPPPPLSLRLFNFKVKEF